MLILPVTKLALFFQNGSLPQRHKGAELWLSLRGPKGRGNLLHDRQKNLITRYIDWLCLALFFRLLQSIKFFIITFHIDTYAYFAYYKIGFVFSKCFLDAKAQSHKGTEENNVQKNS